MYTSCRDKIYINIIIYYIVPDPPSSVSLTPLNSSSLQLTWDMPIIFKGNITDYNYTCMDLNATRTYSSKDEGLRNFVNEDRVVILTGLEPFREYMCNVTAATSAGIGPAAGTTGVTGQAG